MLPKNSRSSPDRETAPITTSVARIRAAHSRQFRGGIADAQMSSIQRNPCRTQRTGEFPYDSLCVLGIQLGGIPKPPVPPRRRPA